MLSKFAKSLITVVTLLLLVTTLAMLHQASRAYIDPWSGQLFGQGGVEQGPHRPGGTKGGSNFPSLKGANLNGGVIMPKLGNATAKAELGRATWKLMHTMTLRYPKQPSADERQALSSYFYLLSRLYPCGECATEFQQLLAKYPPQTSSRQSASQWLCGVHNEVNKRLNKPIFDCAHVDSTYDCGCGDVDDAEKTKDPSAAHSESEKEHHDGLTGIEMIRGGRR